MANDWSAVEDVPLNQPAASDWTHVEDVPLASLSKPASNDFQPVEDIPLTPRTRDASFIGALTGNAPVGNAESMGGYDSSISRDRTKPTALPEDNGVGRAQTAAGEFVKGVSGVVASIPKSIALIANQQSNIKLATDALDKIDAGQEAAPRYVGDISQENPNPYIRDIVGKYRSGDETARKQIREHLGAWSEKRPDQDPLYQAGKKFDEYMGSLIKENPRYQQEFWAGKVPQGLGSTFGFLLSGAATGGAGVALSGAASGSVQGYEDALDNGATLEQALNSAGLNALVGTSEALPISHLLDRVDKGTGGVIKRALVNAMKSGSEEAIQEAGQQIMQNLVASKVVKYDPNRGTFDGAGPNAGVGFTSGGLLSFLTTVIAGRRARGARPDQAAPQEQVAPTTQEQPSATPVTAPVSAASAETAWEPIADIPLGKDFFQQEQPVAPVEQTAPATEQAAPVINDQSTISPDPARDLNAQVSQMFDPQAGRDSVLIPINTDASVRDTAVAEATKNGAVSIDTPAGTVLTTNVQKADAIQAAPYSPETMGQILFGQPVTPKEQTDGTVVQSRTPEGAISSSVVTNQQNLPQDALAVARTAAPTDTLETTTVDKGLAERQAQVAAESKPALSADTRLKLKAKGFSEDAVAKMTAPQLVNALGTGNKATKNKLMDVLASSVKRMEQDQAGKDILDNLAVRGVSPKRVADKFWSDIYFKLPASTQQKFTTYLKKLTGFQPGSVLSFNPTTGEKEIATDWGHIAKFFTGELPENVDSLEGTERGYVALMDEATRRTTNSITGAQNDALQVPRPNAVPVAQAAQTVGKATAAPAGVGQSGQGAVEPASPKTEAKAEAANTAVAKTEPYIAEMTKAAAAMSEAAKEMSAAAKEMTAARAQPAQASAATEKATTAKTAPASDAAVKPEPTAKEPGGQYAAKPKPAVDRKAEQVYSDASEAQYQTQSSEPTGTAKGSGKDVLATIAGGPPAQGWSGATRIRGKSGPLAVIRGERIALSKDHFGLGALGKNTEHPTSGFGVFFSNDANVAAKHGSVARYYLDIRNPKVIKVENLPAFDTVEQAHAFREKLRRQGYDGIVISARHLGDGRVDIAAFDASQVIPVEEKTVKEPESAYDVSKSYQNTDATKEQKALGQSAVDDLGRKIARGGRLLGSRLPKEFVAKGGISLIGQKVNGAEDLAQLAQVYRDPRFETFRIFFTKGNEIVGQSGISSRLPGQTKVFTNGPEQGVRAIADQMTALKADGYYLLHNHPSGEPDASQADIGLTAFMRDRIPGFKNHVIINEKQFGVISNESGKTVARTVFKDMPSPYKLNESAQVQHYILGEKIQSPSDLARLAKHVQKSDGYFVLIGSNRTGVTGIMELPLELLKNKLKAGAAVKRFAQSNGSSSVYATGLEHTTANERIVNDAVNYGFLRDVIYADGISAAESHANQLDAGDFTLGRRGDAHRAFSAAEEKDVYNKKGPHQIHGLNQSGEIAAVAVPKTDGSWEIYHGNEKTLASSTKFRREAAINQAAALASMQASGMTIRTPPRAPNKAAPPFNGFNVPGENVVNYLVRQFQDKFRRLKVTEKAIKEQGGKVNEGNDAYLEEELFHGKTEDRLRQFKEEHVDPLVEAIKAEGVSMEDVDRYLYAKHAPERNAHIDSINPHFKENGIAGSGMTNAEASTILDDFRKAGIETKLAKVAKKVYAINEARLRLLEKEGLESAETLKMWGTPYKNYVPLRGFEADTDDSRPRTGSGFDIRGKESKQALGRQSKAISPMTYSVVQMEESIIRSEKNNVGKTFLKLVEDNPNSALWEVNKTEFKPAFNKNTGEVVYRPDNNSKLADNVLSVKVDGKQTLITLHDELMARAMKNVGVDRTNAFVRGIGAANRFLAMVNTSLNPEFVLSNFARDIQTAMINLYGEQGIPSSLGTPKGIATRVLKDVPMAMAGAYSGLRGNKGGKWTTWFNEYRADGGKIGFFGLDSIENKRKRIQRELKLASGGTAAKAESIIRDFGGLISDVNSAVENAVRLAAYKNARELGVSRKQAASLARNLTVNFNRKGELGSVVGSFYLFYNASVQGSTRLLYAMKSPRVRKIMLGIAGTAFMLAELNRLVGGDDPDDGENYYDKIPSYVKERNLIIMRPNSGGKYYSLPLPYGYNIPHVVGSGINDIYHGRNKAKTATQTVMAIMNSFNPIGGDGPLIQQISPTVVDPFVQIAMNQNFYGGKIHPDQMPFGPKKPNSQLFFNSVSPVSKEITDTLNSLTGGNSIRPGAIDVSPESLDYAVSQFFGGAGAFVNRVVNYTALLTKEGEIPSNKIPFVRRFIGEQSQSYVPQNFRQRVDEVLLAHEEVDGLRKQGKYSEAQDAREQNSDLLRLYGKAKSFSELVSSDNKRIRDIRNNKNITDSEREIQIKSIQQRMDARMKQFNKAYSDATLSP